MTNYDVGVGAATLRLVVLQSSQNVSANTSIVSWALHLICGNGVSWNGNPVGWSVTINGAVYSGSYTFDFRGTTDVVIAGTTTTVAHNSDGTKTIAVQGHTEYTGSSAIGGPATVNGTFTLSTIPRASGITYSPNPPLVAGNPVTFFTNRASTAFGHDLSYAFFGASGVIATGVTDSYTWPAVPLTLLNQIPNLVTGNVTFKMVTKQGATVIGTTTRVGSITAGPTIVPTFTDVTLAEATAGVAAAIGGYVQGVSTLAFAITGAAGVYSSTIVGYKLEINGVTVATTQSGTTPVITASGTVAVKATVTDSRGRTATMTKNITVLPYTPPQITSATFKRATSGGTLDDNGTFIRVDLTASVQSLIVSGTQKNQLTHKTSSRLRGTSSWSVKETTPTGAVTYNTFFVVTGPFAVTSAWELLEEVSDIFQSTGIQATVPVAAVFMHWDANLGVGIGKYRENGMLDVNGAIYSRGGMVLDPPSTGIQASTVGVVAPLQLQANGGDTALGGRLVAPHNEYAMAAGSVSFSFPSGAASATGVTVTLPVGRFTQAPLPFANLFTAPANSQKAVVRAYSSTATSITIGAWTGDQTGLAAAFTAVVSWMAVQMTATTAAG